MALYLAGPAWHVLHVETTMEFAVHREVERLGFSGYVPKERIRVRSTRRGPKRPPEVISRPLLPGYVFVVFDRERDDWAPLRRIKGAIDILQNNGVPGRVPTAWVDAMHKAEAVGIFDRTGNEPSMFLLGDEVKVDDGPFAGFCGVIFEFICKLRAARASKRAKIMIKYMHRLVDVEIDLTSLSKVT